MATGYTASIYQGKKVSGKDFIATCASAFGAYVTKRDESIGADLPELQPSNYHLTALKNARIELENLNLINHEDIKKQIDTENEESLQREKEYFEENVALKARYEATLNEVKNWVPPTPEHVELKKFCIRQLIESISYDCSDTEEFRPSSEQKKTPAEYLYEKELRILENIKYHQKQYGLEVERTNERNNWISELRESLSNL